MRNSLFLLALVLIAGTASASQALLIGSVDGVERDFNAGGKAVYHLTLTNTAKSELAFGSTIRENFSKYKVNSLLAPSSGVLRPGETIEVTASFETVKATPTGGYTTELSFYAPGFDSSNIIVHFDIRNGSTMKKDEATATSKVMPAPYASFVPEEQEDSNSTASGTANSTPATGFVALSIGPAELGLWFLLGIIASILLVRFLAEMVKRYHYETFKEHGLNH